MATAPVQTLLAAVRRRLWRGQFVAALRLALWGSAALTLVAVAVHLAVRPVAPEALLSALAALWVSMLAWAAARRPGEPACALWADRHLGGASAFTTLLELGSGRQGAASAQALRWLEDWAAARALTAQALLARRQASARLARPLLSMLVCMALATLVLTLPDLAPRRQAGASSAPGAEPRPLPMAGVPASSAEVASDIETALRSAASQAGPERRDAASGRSPAPGGAADASASQAAKSQGEETAAAAARPAAPVDAASHSQTARSGGASTGAGAGRGAGESRDERAEFGVSRALRGGISMPRSEAGVRRPSREKQADMDQWATYDEESSMPRAATLAAHPAPAAATPPPATQAERLTLTQASYVQAWLKASAGRQ